MIVRNFRPSDLSKIESVHKKFYKEEFPIEDYLSCRHVLSILSDDKELITTIGLRPIMEMIAITDKDQKVRARKIALLEGLLSVREGMNLLGFNQLHAFIQDEHWIKHLRKVGFKSCKGQAMVLEI